MLPPLKTGGSPFFRPYQQIIFHAYRPLRSCFSGQKVSFSELRILNSPISTKLVDHLSHEKKGPWLVGLYRGWKTTQVCGDYFKNHCKDPIKPPVEWKVRGFFSWLISFFSLNSQCLLGQSQEITPNAVGRCWRWTFRYWRSTKVHGTFQGFGSGPQPVMGKSRGPIFLLAYNWQIFGSSLIPFALASLNLVFFLM